MSDMNFTRIRFYGHNSAIFLTNRAEIYIGNSRDYNLYFLNSFLGPKIGRGSTGPPMSLGPQNLTKKLTLLVELLGHLLPRNNVSNFLTLDPLP